MSNQKPYNIKPNIEAAFSYLLGPLSGAVVYYFNSKGDNFVKFHAAQSFLFGSLYLIIKLVVHQFGLLVAILFSGFNFLVFFVWMLLMYKAYNNEKYKLPVLGDIANDYSR